MRRGRSIRIVPEHEVWVDYMAKLDECALVAEEELEREPLLWVSWSGQVRVGEVGADAEGEQSRAALEAMSSECAYVLPRISDVEENTGASGSAMLVNPSSVEAIKTTLAW